MINILFLNKDGFPIKTIIESGTAKELKIRVPDGAKSVRLELQLQGYILIRVEKVTVDGKNVECIPQNAAGIQDGNLFINSPPRYMVWWKQSGVRSLNIKLKILELSADDAVTALMSSMEAWKIDRDAREAELSRLNMAFNDIFTSNAWRAVRVYYRIKDIIKMILKLIPASDKQKRSLAARFGFFTRPAKHTRARIEASQAYYRIRDRISFPLSIQEPAAVKQGTIAVHLHLYYSDLLDEFCEWFSRIPFEYDLYISLVDNSLRKTVAGEFKKRTKAKQIIIEVVENKGRDVAPMLINFGDRLSEYDYFLHIHTKKSPHEGGIPGWRQYLLDNLLKDESHIRRIFGLFEDHPELGILYPEIHPDTPYWTLTTQSNIKEMKRLFKILELPFSDKEKYIDFPVGTMFWARGAALKGILRSGITLEDFPKEDGQVDGTLAHAVERSLALIAAKDGYIPAQVDVEKDYVNIGVGRRNVTEYLAMNASDMSGYVSRFRNASFDLFGTLIVSSFEDDEALWEEVGQKINDTDFIWLRKEAQVAAERRNGAVDIHNVYMELKRLSGFSAEQCERIKNTEFQTLLASLKPRDTIAVFFNDLCHFSGKDVVIAEDTVWPKAYVVQMLEACGVYSKRDIYLSNEIGLYKRDGRLYDYLKGRFKGQAYVNIGDDELIDLHIPAQRRIHSFHIMNPVDMAAVAGLTDEEKTAYYEKMRWDPFCLSEIMEEKAKAKEFIVEDNAEFIDVH